MCRLVAKDDIDALLTPSIGYLLYDLISTLGPVICCVFKLCDRDCFVVYQWKKGLYITFE